MVSSGACNRRSHDFHYKAGQIEKFPTGYWIVGGCFGAAVEDRREPAWTSDVIDDNIDLMKQEEAPARYHHGNLRSGLCEAAVLQLSEQTEDALSLRALAKSVGVSVAAVYRHFSSKEALLAEVALQGFGSLMQRWDRELPAAGSVGAQQRFQQLGEIYIDFALASPAHFRLMFGARDLREFPELRAAAEQCFGYVLEASRATLAEAGADEKWMLPLANAAWSLVHGYVHLALTGLLTETGGKPDLPAALLPRFLQLPPEAAAG
jgi:AcrR family transcriptional regulator